MATEKEAIERGYEFTGIYSHDKAEVKNRQNEYTGYKTLLVNVPPNKLSRGHHGMGYSVYVEPRYARDQAIENCETRISEEDQLIAAKLKEYEEAVAAIRYGTQQARDQLAALKAQKEN